MVSKFMIAGLRRSARSPGFSLAVLVLVALAVFVNASAFGALYTLRLKALPFTEGDRLVVPEADLRAFGVRVGLTTGLREHLKAQSAVFSAVAGYTVAGPQRELDSHRDWRLARVTDDLLPLLGARPALGRMPAAAETDVVLVSDAVWREQFGADPALIGRSLRFGARSLRVVGVMPAGFIFPRRDVDGWTPYVASAEEQLRSARGNVGDLDVLARLADGVGIAQAQAALAATFQHEPSLEALRDQGGLVAVVGGLRERYAADAQAALLALAAAAILLLLVVGFNLGSLLLERVARRERELAVRRALGAGRGALLLAACGDLAILAALGALAGIAALPLGMLALRRFGLLPTDLPLQPGLDPVIVGFALLLGALLVLGALAVGAFGSVRRVARAALNAPLAAHGLGASRALLLVGQLALTTVLLGGGLLLLRSTANLLDEDTGFDRRQVLLANIDLAAEPGLAEADLGPAASALREQLAALPGVSAVAQVNLVPFSGSESVNSSSWDDGEPPRRARQRLVTPGYFAAMGITLRAGRDFADADQADAAGVVVVDERFVERYLAGRDPLTATVRIATGTQDESRQARVIGVAHTIRHGSLDEQSELATMYELGTDPAQLSWYVLRSAQDPAALAQTVRAEVERRLPSARVAMLLPLGELVERSVRQRRAIARAVAVFGGATLLLAALGLYAALAFAFQRRRQELAVRMALGATPQRIVVLVLRQGLLLAALALPFGVLAGVLLAFQQAPMLYRLQPGDPVTWSLAAASIVIATLLAALPSALGAARIAPHSALRTE